MKLPIIFIMKMNLTHVVFINLKASIGTVLKVSCLSDLGTVRA